MGRPITVTDGVCFAFPDVCLTPAPPGPNVPVPYPNIAQLSAADRAATSVNAGGKPVVTADSEIAHSSGGEPGTGKGVTSGTHLGTCAFVASSVSQTVKANGHGVVRLGDQTEQNGGNARGTVLGGFPRVLVGG